MAELEATGLTNGRAAVSVERMPELDATRHARAAELPAAPVAELEPTRLPSVAAVAETPVPELERGRVTDPGPRTAVSAGPAVCRYCKTPQAEGAICERCGMRLPRIAAKAKAPAQRSKAETTRCRACGAPAKAGERCGDCGREVKAPES